MIVICSDHLASNCLISAEHPEVCRGEPVKCGVFESRAAPEQNPIAGITLQCFLLNC